MISPKHMGAEELLTLRELSEKVENVDLETILENLKKHDIEVDSPDAVVGEIAEAHDMTPMQLYDMAVGQAGRKQDAGRGRGQGGARQGAGSQSELGKAYGNTGAAGGPGRGFSRMTLTEYCAEMELDVETIVQQLKDAGYEVNPDMTLRTIADKAGVHPSQIRTVIEPASP